jgi:phosphatidylinositol alpha-1,6-mannosyltransferase
MKILIISDQYPPHYFGGMSQHTYHIAKNLSDLGHRVLLILPKHFKVSAEKGNLEIRSILRSNYFLNSVIVGKVKREFGPELQHIVTAGMFYPSLVGHVPTIQRVVGNDFLRPWRGRGVFFRKYFNQIPLLGNLLGRIDVIARKKSVLYELRKVDLILPNSEWTRSRLVESGIEPDNILCLSGGVDLKIFKPIQETTLVKKELELDMDTIYILTAGNLIGKKGFDTVLRAMPAVLAEGYNISYLIAGEGPDKHKLKRIVGKLQLDDRVSFLGALGQEELAKYLAVCSMYVQVSRNHIISSVSVDVETMGRTYIEAGACSIPVIASNIGGIPSVVRHEYNGLLLDNPEDYITLSSYIINMLSKPSELKRMGNNGFLRATNEFDWEILTQRILMEFEKIHKSKSIN